ncbi:MAG: thioredoxin domain-containing protein [Hyphomicrobiaceae bacterium]|nr:thioredoxin domain-containing protein [Hyphomicrobiaceae bacterium]
MKNILRIAILAIAIPLAGCGADGLPPVSAVSKDGPADGGAFPSAGTRVDGMPAPFGEPQTATAAREVIANPTVADVMAPSPLPEMSWGSATAPVTIVQYASLTCPYCRRFHKEVFPQLKSTYIDTGKVRYILREFPIGKTSGAATIALRCAPPEKYLELYGLFLDQQPAWVSQEVRPDAIFAVAQQVGMTRAQFDACRENHVMIENLKWVKERGRKLGIIGTPNFFIGNKLYKRVLTMDDIRALVEQPQSNNDAAMAAQPAGAN